MARLLSAGELRLVRIPEPDEEQLRDLVRSREDLRVDLTRIRNRIGKFLLRREIYAHRQAQCLRGIDTLSGLGLVARAGTSIAFNTHGF